MNSIVIGSGFGGIAAALRLKAKGHQVTLIEKHQDLGGRARVFKKNGFIFDGGPTVITDPNCIEELFTVSGKVMKDYVTLLPVDPFYRLQWEDGQVLDYNNDQLFLEKQIGERNKDDINGYRKFLEYSKDLYREGYEKLGTTAFLKVSQMFAAAPQLM